MTIAITSQDSSRPACIDFDGLTSICGAEPVNIHGQHCAFAESMHDANGKRYVVTYGFSEAEEAEAGDDASALPFDAAHVVRCVEAE